MTSWQKRQYVDRRSDSADDGQMERHIEKLERSLAAIALDLGIIEATCATKSDFAELKATVSEAKITIIVWVVAVVVLAQILPALLEQFGLS